jgi:hypothetical protein
MDIEMNPQLKKLAGPLRDIACKTILLSSLYPGLRTTTGLLCSFKENKERSGGKKWCDLG